MQTFTPEVNKTYRAAYHTGDTKTVTIMDYQHDDYFNGSDNYIYASDGRAYGGNGFVLSVLINELTPDEEISMREPTYVMGKTKHAIVSPRGEVTDVPPEIFKFLDAVRDSGAINMFGAPPLIAEVMEIDKRTAREVLEFWMKRGGKHAS